MKLFDKRRWRRFVRSLKRRPIKSLLSALIVLVSFYTTSMIIAFLVLTPTLYPNTKIGSIEIEGMPASEAVRRVKESIDITSIVIELPGRTQKFTPSQLGIELDEERLIQSLEDMSTLDVLRPWVLVRNYDVPLAIDVKKAQSTLAVLADDVSTKPKNATLTINDDVVDVAADKPAMGLNTAQMLADIKAQLERAVSEVRVVAEPSEIEADITEAELRQLIPRLMKIVGAHYVVEAGNQRVVIPQKQIESWIHFKSMQNGAVKVVANKKLVKQYVDSLAASFAVSPRNQVTTKYASGKKPQITVIGRDGKKALNQHEISAEIGRAISLADIGKTFTFTLEPVKFTKVSETVDDTRPSATYTYDVAVWGTVGGDLATFKALVAQTLVDSRGWSAAGISFAEVASGGDFTLVLAEPARVAAISSGCSAEYSCRSGRYVIINDARWQGATVSWNGGGGSLRDYRNMVVNHEVGHWLGFGHQNCAAPGALAPVMQQQSISLQGCAYNPWPLANEINAL